MGTDQGDVLLVAPRGRGGDGIADDTREQWHVYIVRCADRSFYTGIARDVEARVSRHNDGSGARYTRGRRPVALVYSERAQARGPALQREHEIKRMSVARKRALIDGDSTVTK